MSMVAYKLFSDRGDGLLSPLFINVKQRLVEGKWYEAEEHPTKGFAVRPGWHCTLRPEAVHLVMNPKGKPARVWAKVEVDGYQVKRRPKNQGGTWLIAKRMKILEIL